MMSVPSSESADWSHMRRSSPDMKEGESFADQCTHVCTGVHLLRVFLDRAANEDLLSGPYKDMWLSSKAVQMSSFSFAVGFIIRNLACFLFLFVEKKHLCCAISLLAGSFLVIGKEFARCFLALSRFMAEVIYI